MKKPLVYVSFLALALSLSGCGTSSADKALIESLTTDKDNLAAENESLSHQMQSISAELDRVSKDYESYKQSMNEYEGLASAEAEARKIQAEEIAESKAKEEAAAAEAAAKAAAESEAAAAASREAEERIGYETGITYDQLARNPEQYKGKKVKFKGKVVQLMEGSYENEIRLATKGSYDNIIYCSYSPDIVSSRILEDDEITIYGVSVGTISYQSTLSGKITIPGVSIDKIDQ